MHFAGIVDVRRRINDGNIRQTGARHIQVTPIHLEHSVLNPGELKRLNQNRTFVVLKGASHCLETTHVSMPTHGHTQDIVYVLIHENEMRTHLVNIQCI